MDLERSGYGTLSLRIGVSRSTPLRYCYPDRLNTGTHCFKSDLFKELFSMAEKK